MVMNTDKVSLSLSMAEVQYVLSALAKRPYEEVANLIALIHGQATAAGPDDKTTGSKGAKGSKG
jgi:hypothetical protein